MCKVLCSSLWVIQIAGHSFILPSRTFAGHLPYARHYAADSALKYMCKDTSEELTVKWASRIAMCYDKAETKGWVGRLETRGAHEVHLTQVWSFPEFGKGLLEELTSELNWGCGRKGGQFSKMPKELSYELMVSTSKIYKNICFIFINWNVIDSALCPFFDL